MTKKQEDEIQKLKAHILKLECDIKLLEFDLIQVQDILISEGTISDNLAYRNLKGPEYVAELRKKLAFPYN